MYGVGRVVSLGQVIEDFRFEGVGRYLGVGVSGLDGRSVIEGFRLVVLVFVYQG